MTETKICSVCRQPYTRGVTKKGKPSGEKAWAKSRTCDDADCRDIWSAFAARPDRIAYEVRKLEKKRQMRAFVEMFTLNKPVPPVEFEKLVYRQWAER